MPNGSTKGFSFRTGSLAVALGLAFYTHIPSALAEVYVYKRSDGSTVITGRQRSDDSLELIKRFRSSSRPIRSVRALKPVISRYDPLIHQVSIREKVEASLLKAVVHVESGFNERAISHKGAVGLMQLMPSTAREYGVTSRMDPTQNLFAGGRHLHDLLSLYEGDSSLALAAYNAGRQAVARYNGIPPYPETRDYVRKVLALRELYRAQ